MIQARADNPGATASRYECKYLVAPKQAEAIRKFAQAFVAPDPYAANLEGYRYSICSLYLDSSDLSLYRQTVEGTKNRFKLRVRTYGDDALDPVFFEVKRRMNGVVIKSRSKTSRDRALEYLMRRRSGHGGLEEFANLSRLTSARPSLRVRYVREAYESPVDRVRVTFDTELQHSITTSPNISHNGPGWARTPIDGVILELKFTDQFPSWVRELIDRFQLQRTSIAKYVMSVDEASVGGGLERALRQSPRLG